MSLTATQRKILERRLRDERERALETLNRTLAERASASEQDRSGDLTLLPMHPADLGTDAIDTELDVSNATRISQELAEIDAALERLYSAPERFGICEDTGDQIPFERLEIIPWARTCGQAERT
ncbi:MAG TPA: TraR/DksA C4-type zinc finger protein [Gemmatimonadaceae bacterium]